MGLILALFQAVTFCMLVAGGVTLGSAMMKGKKGILAGGIAGAAVGVAVVCWGNHRINAQCADRNASVTQISVCENDAG